VFSRHKLKDTPRMCSRNLGIQTIESRTVFLSVALTRKELSHPEQTIWNFWKYIKYTASHAESIPFIHQQRPPQLPTSRDVSPFCSCHYFDDCFSYFSYSSKPMATWICSVLVTRRMFLVVLERELPLRLRLLPNL